MEQWFHIGRRRAEQLPTRTKINEWQKTTVVRQETQELTKTGCTA
jgi:hypothetical protein